MSLDLCLEIEVDTGGTPYRAELFEANITHNLGEMAEACGLYNVMWRPYRLYNIKDEDGDDFEPEAGELIDAIEFGLNILKSDPIEYKMFNPGSGWGDYDGLVRVASKYLEACKKYPKATVKAYR